MKIIQIPVQVNIILRATDRDYTDRKDIVQRRLSGMEGELEQAVEEAVKENLDLTDSYGNYVFEFIGASAVVQ